MSPREQHGPFYAHSTSTSDRSDWHLLADHLREVGRLAGDFAASFGGEQLAQAAGVLHDLGKRCPEFQARLRGAARRVDHSTAGAIVAAERWHGPIGQLLAFCIAGHHAGLANGRAEGERTALIERLAARFGNEISDLVSGWEKELQLPERLTPPLLARRDPMRDGFQYAFLVRMIFSALVDADYLDTEAFYSRLEGRRPERGQYPALAVLRAELDRHLGELAGHADDSPVNRLRAEILTHVRMQADLGRGMFSLTVPTGGGKTLTSLAFALDHAIAHGLSRVIYVIPFTSVIEQTAAVFRKALGTAGKTAVLEHHSAFHDSRSQAPEAQAKLRLAMERWDTPIVVTTAVQFFESVFADRPASCRKLHNIANSVVILDEAQTLPLKLLRPCVAALDELVLNYRSSVVICTATQPALEERDGATDSFRGGLRGVRELAPEPMRLYTALRRVRVRVCDAPMSDEELAERLQNGDQVLCIVNSRRHARSLYERIRHLSGARHLSTLMYAHHRRAVFDHVREDLRSGRPCRLVATSLIEAGVDVDFPLVLRAAAGLDSIAQAAGRCNREGRRPAESSDVIVFHAPDWPTPPELAQVAQAAAEVLRRHDDPLSLAAIEEYFRLLYWQREAGNATGLDAHDLLGRLAEAGLDVPFEDVARRFRMIESAQRPVIIPGDADAQRTIEALRFVERPGALARRLQPYLVQLPERAYAALRLAGAVQPVLEERFAEQFMVLVNPDLYRQDVGISWEDPDFVNSERLVW